MELLNLESLQDVHLISAARDIPSQFRPQVHQDVPSAAHKYQKERRKELPDNWPFTFLRARHLYRGIPQNHVVDVPVACSDQPQGAGWTVRLVQIRL